MPVDPLGNGDAAVPGQACDVFEGDAVSAEQADSGVPTAEAKTSPCSCHIRPASSRAPACWLRCSLSA